MVERLDNVTVYVGRNTEDISRLIEEKINSGELHIKEEYINKYGSPEKALEKIKKDTEHKAGIQYPSIKEPAIFLVEYDVYSMKSTTVHECAHLIDISDERYEDAGIVPRAGIQYDRELDTVAEIYAHAMEFRKAFNIDPNKVFTESDIRSFRARLREDSQRSSPTLSSEQKRALELLMDRYPSDEQISSLLNTMAQAEPENRIDRDDVSADMHLTAEMSRRRIEKVASANKTTNEEPPAREQQTNPFVINRNDNQYS